MSKLTKEFVEGFLDRYDGDLSGPILDLADGGNPLHALLKGLDRKDIIEWLQEEFDGLLMHGFEPVQDIDLPERKNSELLLAFLEKTKPENSRGLQFEIEAVGDPEEGYTPEKYIQAYEVSIRHEGTGLGTCALESEGAYISGKWVAESAQWPTLLQGVVPLPTVVIQEPQHQRQELDRIEERETKAEPREISGLSHGDVASIYGAYHKLKARQGGLSAVSIGELAKQSGVPVPRVQQFLLSEARQDRVDLHATSLVWHSLSPEDKAGATAVPGRSEPAITVTIRQKLVTAALPAGLDIIKAYDDIVDGAEARKRLEQTNPSLVAARDKAITELPREKLQKETAERQHKVARVRSR
jgi:hypothetical protein